MFEVSTASCHTNLDKRRLVAERAKFAKHVMVSAGVCFGGKGRLHFIPDTAKVNVELYVETLLLELVQGYTAKLAPDWIATNCSELIGKDEWPPNSLDLNPLDYHVIVWGAMLERFKPFQPKPENINELKKVLQLIWYHLPQDSINKAILSFPKRLRACVKAGGGHFVHMLK